MELATLQTNEDLYAEFILPGATVLTTGAACATDPQLLATYAKNCKDKGAIGIGFGVGIYFDSVPKILVDACKEYGLELFSVPKPIAFATIIQAAHAELVRQTQVNNQWLLEFQEQCNQYASRGGIDALMSFISNKLDCAVAIIDNDGRLYGVQERFSDSVRLLAQETVEKAQFTSRALQYKDYHALISRMHAQGERFFLLVSMREKSFDSRSRTAFRHCSGLLEILLQRPMIVRATRNEINQMAMALLIGATHEESRAVDKIFHQVIDSQGRIRPVVIEAPDPNILDAALASIDQCSERRGRSLFALRFGEGSSEDCALLFFRGSRKIRDIRADIDVEKFQLRCAIGPPTPIRDIDSHLTQQLLIEAMSAQRGSTASGSVPSWLYNPSVAEAMKMRRSQTYDFLSQYDSHNGTHLCATLEAFIRLDGHVQHVADTLGVHRHTVRSRVTTIQEICDINLSDPVVKAELLLIFLASGPGLSQ